MSTLEKRFTILAGPNGSGKTTFVQNIFPDLLEQNHFINADIFAQKINPDDVSKAAIPAGKKLIKELDRFLDSDDSFILETTLSGQSLLTKIEIAKKRDFFIKLIFLWLLYVELCDFRVKGRVASGGHNIPFEDIRRRYHRGLHNFPEYLKFVDECQIYLAEGFPKLIFHKKNDMSLEILDQKLYDQFSLSIKNADI